MNKVNLIKIVVVARLRFSALKGQVLKVTGQVTFLQIGKSKAPIGNSLKFLEITFVVRTKILCLTGMMWILYKVII